MRSYIGMASILMFLTSMPANASNTPPSGTYKGCPEIGSPKPRELAEARLDEATFAFVNETLNKLKNRAEQANGAQPRTVQWLNEQPNSRRNLLQPLEAAYARALSTSDANQRAALHSNARAETMSLLKAAFRDAEPLEGEPIFVEGYLSEMGARKEGPESPNCYGMSGFDFHIWLVDSQGDPRRDAAVVEMTPRWEDFNGGWQIQKLQAFARNGVKVRVYGYPLFDPEHPSEVGKTRGGQWEIHPITKIEYFEAGGWHEL